MRAHRTASTIVGAEPSLTARTGNRGAVDRLGCRTASLAASPPPSRYPHPRQNFRSRGFTRSHRGHGASGASGVPQLPQKEASSGFVAVQDGQFIRPGSVNNEGPLSGPLALTVVLSR